MDRRAGYGYGLSAYLLWGVLPLYFVLLAAVDPFEIVAWRILLTLVFCAILLTITRQWGETWALLRDRGAMLRLSVAGLVIYVNWQVFIIASTTGHVLDASLGYFLNPVITVVFAVVLLGERLTAMQWGALAATVVAFAVIAVGYGAFPWAGLLLALSFGFYGYLKNRVGAQVSAIPGLFIETVVLTPVAVGILIVVTAITGTNALDLGGGTLALLALAGVATAVPLLLFAGATRRLPLQVVGFLQYLAPTLMFFLGWLVLGEDIPLFRWLGFGLVWAALALLTLSSLRRSRGRIADAT